MKAEKESNNKKNQSANIGRPPMNKEKKKDEQIFVNVTISQKKLLTKLAEKDDISLSRLCLNALKEAGYLTTK